MAGPTGDHRFFARGKAEPWRRVEHDDAGREGLYDTQLLALHDAEGVVFGAMVVR